MVEYHAGAIKAGHALPPDHYGAVRLIGAEVTFDGKRPVSATADLWLKVPVDEKGFVTEQYTERLGEGVRPSVTPRRAS